MEAETKPQTKQQHQTQRGAIKAKCRLRATADELSHYPAGRAGQLNLERVHAYRFEPDATD